MVQGVVGAVLECESARLAAREVVVERLGYSAGVLAAVEEHDLRVTEVGEVPGLAGEQVEAV